MNSILIVMLLWVFYEDLKERKVTLLLLLLLMIVGIFLNIKQHILIVFLLNSIINLGLIFGVIITLYLYAKLKLKTPLFQVFGLGDLLFFIFMAISFPTTTFIILFSASLVFSLLISVVFRQQLKKMIPLAGLQALFVSLMVGGNLLFNFVDLYAF